jgi:bifunctional N-acetylglucosamine-1-phosphate-uridyltransferase/glucosamine-1-phosphate-acetyltransferase GlmU-like protein
MPLMKKSTYESLTEVHTREQNACTILSGFSEEELPYGRIIRDLSGHFARIVEDKDCTAGEKAVRELNAGVYIFEKEPMLRMLGRLGKEHAQGEYYLTDVPALLLAEGKRVGVCDSCSPPEMLGVNTPAQLKQVEEEIETLKQNKEGSHG